MMKAVSCRTFRSALPFVAVAVVLTLCVVMSGCGKPAEPAAGRQDPAKRSAFTFPDQSRFADQVLVESYAETEPPSLVPMFEWNFSRKRDYTYDYHQQVATRMAGNMARQDGGMEQAIEGDGNIVMRSKGNGKADLLLKNMVIATQMKGPDGSEHEMTQKAPTMTIQGIDEEGASEITGSSQELFLHLLFPLPPEDLAVGESVEIPATMPFAAMGSMLEVTGKRRFVLTKYVDIDGRKCAQLDTEINISQLDIPEEMEGEYSCSTKGVSRFYFDTERRCFISGKMAFLICFLVDAPVPEMEMKGMRDLEMPKRTSMRMVSDNLFEIDLEHIR